MDNTNAKDFTGANIRTVEQIAKQKENARIAYSLMGLELPEKATKTRTSSTGRKYLLGFHDIVNNGRKIAVSELIAPEDTPVIDPESMARTLRAYIAYKIGHSLKELKQENGTSLFYFRNRITNTDKTCEVNMADVDAYQFVVAFYKDCITEITDKWAIFTHENGKFYLLAVNAGHFHTVEVANPEVKA